MTARIVARGDIAVAWVDQRPHVTGALQRRIDEIWAEAQRDTASLYDSDVLSLVSWTMSGPTVSIVGRFVPYRHFVARQRDPELEVDVRPLAVCGFTTVGGSVLIGRRSHESTEYPGGLELVPSGSIDRRAALPSGAVDLQAMILDELAEEARLRNEARVRPLGLIHDEAHDVYDVGCLIQLAEGTPAAGPEYQSLCLADSNEVVSRRGELVPTSKMLLDLAMGAV